MRREITMPHMGEMMEEGKLVRWLKDVGEEVEHGEVIAEIETDKAVVEMEAFVSGTLNEIVVSEGETVPVGTVIAIIEDGRPEPESVEERRPEPEAGAMTAEMEHGTMRRERVVEKHLARHETEEVKTKPRRVKASPVARRLAAEHGLDLRGIKGTGPEGSIITKDVEAWLAAQQPTEPTPAEAEGVKRVSLSKIKLTTARRMAESKATIPHFYTSMDIEMSRALALRDSLKARGQEVSINALILKATALALAEYPNLNATFAGDELHIHPHINLAIAVALDEGLITPVIHNCEGLSLTDLAVEAEEVIERARTGRLRPEDLDGGTFTVSNLGMFGIKQFEAIVNAPQAAILAVGGVRRVPAFDAHDRVVPVQVLTATVSADHRVTDGVEVARFLLELKGILEDGFRLAAAP